MIIFHEDSKGDIQPVIHDGCLQFVIVVFPDHTHLLFLVLDTYTDVAIMCVLYKIDMIKMRYKEFLYL